MLRVFGVDIGNSGLRIAELHAETLQLGSMLRVNWSFSESGKTGGQNSHGAAYSAPKRYAPDQSEWLAVLQEFLIQHPADQTVWLISSVRRDACGLLCENLLTRPNTNTHIVTRDMLPLEVDVEFPERVGIDRLLAAWAAALLYEQRPLVVVQAGSAVTVDLILSRSPANLAAEADVFAGGAIVPGVPMMLRLLGQATDMLPTLDAGDLLVLPDLPGRNTEQAMLCGTASALVGGVQHLLSRYRAQLGAGVPVILSGGDGIRLSPYLTPPVFVRSHLVHLGLLHLSVLRKTELGCF